MSIVGGVMDFMNSVLNNMWADDRSRKDRARDWYYYQLQSSLDHKYNVASMEKSQQINKEQYDYEYAKESPSARKAQYLAAGLNPGLMYSNGVAGMQGSVGTVQPATSHGTMPNKNMPFYPMDLSGFMDNILKAAQAEKEKSQADYFESEAAENRGETDPSKTAMDLDRAKADLYKSLKGHEDIKAAIDQADLDAKNGTYTFSFKDSQGNVQTYEVAGKYLGTLAKLEGYKKQLMDNDEAQVKLDRFVERWNAEVAKANADATKAQAEAFVADLDKQIIDRLNQEGLYEKSKRMELEKAMEECRRYMAKEFTGSTTEFILAWTQIATSVVNSVNPLGFLKYLKGLKMAGKTLDGSNVSLPTTANGMGTDDLIDSISCVLGE